MGQEIELKLSIDSANVNEFIRHPFIARHIKGTVTKKHLVNSYYDTPDQVLRKHDMTVRVRWDGTGFVQTLKQKGESGKGLTVRGEWEWPLSGPDMDLSLVPLDLLPVSLRARMEALRPVFRTDFERTLWLLCIPAGSLSSSHPPAKVELALDQGEIIAGAGPRVLREEILEIELELLEGIPDILFTISKKLGKEIRLKPFDVSKAERGYRLIEIRSHG